MSSLLEAALAYAAQGWHVFPCLPNSKAPATTRGFYDATTDQKTIRAWWRERPTANVAVWTGTTSGLYVVDVDNPTHPIVEELPPTLQARTPRGGAHYFYALSKDCPLPGTVGGDKDEAKNKLGYKIDARGDGGYVLLAPSVVDGKSYTWVNSGPMAPVPQFIVERMRPQQRERVPYVPSAVTGHGTSAWGQRTLEAVCQELAGVQEGGRNHALNRAAFRVAQAVAGGHVDEWDARAQLTEVALSIGLDEREATRTINSGFRKGLLAPRHPAVRADPLGGAEIVVVDEVAADAIEVPMAERSVAALVVERAADEEKWSLLNDVHDLGGICSTFTDWVLAGADYRQPGLTLGALLSLGAVLGARRFVFDGITSSLYVCAIAPTAEGKGRPQACLRRLLADHWSTTLGPSDFSSGASTVEMLRKTTSVGTGILYVVDEYGARLKTFMDPRVSGHQKELRSLLLDLGTIGTGTYYASMSLARGGETKTIQAPSLSLFGSTTPQALHEAIGRMSLEDGFIGRHVIVEALSRLPMRNWDKPADDNPPADLVRQVESVRNAHTAWANALPPVGKSSDGSPLFMYAPVRMPSVGALERLRDFAEECDARRRDRVEDDIPPQLLGRAAEYAKRVAMVLAVLSAPGTPAPAVTEAHVQLATRAITASMTSMARSIEVYAAESEHEGDRKKVMSALRDLHADTMWVKQRDLLRKCRSIEPKDIAAILVRLADEGVLQARNEVGAKGGRPSMALRLVPPPETV